MHRLLKWTAALLAAGALLLWPEATFDGHRTFAESRAAKDNLHLLAQVVCGEARGEPYEGKVAVAAVILNRVEHPEFPNTIAGVIYEPLAFQVVANGTINQKADEVSLQAAYDALHGVDPTNGALYFYNPAKTRNRWIRTRPVVKKIGRHIFTS